MKNIELFPADRNEKKQADIVDIVETAIFFLQTCADSVLCFIFVWFACLSEPLYFYVKPLAAFHCLNSL